MRIPSSAPPDVQEAFREVWSTLDRTASPLGSVNVDLKGKRIINAGSAVDAFDYVTKGEIATRLADFGLNPTFDTVTVRQTARILGTLSLPRLTDGTAHHAILFVDSSGRVAVNEDGAFALDLNLALGRLELGYDLVVKFFNRSGLASPADAILTMTDHAGTGFNRLVFGPATNAVPALAGNGTTLGAVLGDGSASTKFRAKSLETDDIQILKTTAALSSAPGVGAGTLTNAPSAGDPTKWIAIQDSSGILHLPAW
jgi:hypothetical protein